MKKPKADDLIFDTHHVGECERCHDGPRCHMYGVEGDEEGEWEYCLACAKKVAAALK